ncbi:MAG TPA: hypothetical protein GXX16_01910 [Epulopiscium sp.]|nr:hypothetical protein [Candidatus Epulonipiscium sp.]
MGMNNINNVLAISQYGAVRWAGKAQNVAATRLSFSQILQNIAGANMTKLDTYTDYLRLCYGNVIVKNVGKDQSNIDTMGAGTFGTRNVVIAPYILNQMASDPDQASYFESKIQNYLNSILRYQAELSAMGHEIHSSGIIIHSDGTVTHYVTGDLKPEVRKKIEADIKAEDERKIKLKRKKQHQMLIAEAMARKRMLLEYYQYYNYYNNDFNLLNNYSLTAMQFIMAGLMENKYYL